MMELLFLLLPLAAATGWYSGQRSASRRERNKPKGNPAYFKGLNLLLNEQPDKAIDLFVEMLEVDKDTVETHLALGNLFRRRGEVDRAIRIHQNLIARPTLSKAQRAQALLELGQDYMLAGLYDRAEGLFDELLEMNSHQVESLRNLHLIYQLEKDWDKCLLATRRLEALGEPSLHVARSHYFCELSSEAWHARREDQATAFLKKAVAADRQNIRPSIMLAELAMEREDYETAIRFYSRVESQSPEYFGEVVSALAQCCRKSGNMKMLKDILRHNAEKHGNIESLVTLADIIRNERGAEAATRLIADYLAQHPNLKGVEHLVSLRARQATGETEDFLLLLADVIGQIIDSGYAYRCGHCGFQARRLHWQCPGCKTWGSIKPQPVGECNGRKSKELIVDSV